MFEKIVEHKMREAADNITRFLETVVPSPDDIQVLYRHWLMAHREILQGMTAVIDARLKAIDRPREGRGPQSVPIESSEAKPRTRAGRKTGRRKPASEGAAQS
jgi:hypothetical protein